MTTAGMEWVEKHQEGQGCIANSCSVCQAAWWGPQGVAERAYRRSRRGGQVSTCTQSAAGTRRLSAEGTAMSPGRARASAFARSGSVAARM